MIPKKIFLISIIALNIYEQTWTMFRLTPRFQQVNNSQVEPIKQSIYKKFMPKITPIYDYGRKGVKSITDAVTHTWNHPLYKEGFEPIYVGEELQHNWFEKKHQQFQWLKDTILPTEHNHEQHHQNLKKVGIINFQAHSSDT